MMFEALVSMAIVAVTITAIAGVYFVNLRGIRAASERVRLIEILRQAMAALPDAASLAPGVYDGRIGAYRWRADVLNSALLPAPSVAVAAKPLEVRLTALAPSGQSLQIVTVRLARRGPP